MSLILTQTEVRELCLDVGFTARQARIASAIALCEAPTVVDGQPCSDFGAVGDQELANETWGYSYGGFQVRSLRAQKGTGGTRDADELLKPRFNARSAKIIRRESGWGAWSTYTSGMFRAYLQDMFPPLPGTYVVVYGDTLSTIAQKLGLDSWEALARANGLHSPYRISIGQTLVLP